MKKTLTSALALILTLAALCIPFTSCGENTEDIPTDTAAIGTTEPETEARDEFGRLLVPSSLPQDLKFKGETVTILFRDRSAIMDTTIEFKSDGLNSEPVNDAVYTRNKEVEERLNITLDYTIVDGVSHAPYLNTVRKEWQAGDGSFDIMGYYAYYGVSMATEGMLTNLLNQTYMDFSKPWWNRDFTDELTLLDQLYFAVGDLSLTATKCTNAMFFNKKRMTDMFHDLDLYETVKNGDWTIEQYASLIENCYVDADGDGKRSQGDDYGAMMTAVSIPMDAYILALGCSITEKDEDGLPQIVFGTEHDIDAFGALFDVIIKNPGSLTGPCDYAQYELAQQKFGDADTLFLLDLFHATDFLRTTSIDYGVLPLFKYDKAQAGYWTGVSDTFSLLSIFAGSKQTAQADAVMELMAQKSYEKVTPAYFDISLKQKYSQTNQDAQMFDLILQGRRFNFGFVYSNELNNPTHMWRSIVQNQKNTFSSQLRSGVRTYGNGLKSLLKKYQKMAE